MPILPVIRFSSLHNCVFVWVCVCMCLCVCERERVCTYASSLHNCVCVCVCVQMVGVVAVLDYGAPVGRELTWTLTPHQGSRGPTPARHPQLPFSPPGTEESSPFYM